MAELAGLVAMAVVWSGVRLLRCGRCGLPMGLLQFLYRGVTFSEGCLGCDRVDVPAVQRPLPRRLASTPELQRRGIQIRRDLAAMVTRQAEELRQAREAIATAGGRDRWRSDETTDVRFFAREPLRHA